MSREAVAAIRPIVIPQETPRQRTAGLKATLNAMADFHGPDGCYPAIGKLALWSGIDQRATRWNLKELQRRGYALPEGKTKAGTIRWTLHPIPGGPAIKAVDNRTNARKIRQLIQSPAKAPQTGEGLRPGGEGLRPCTAGSKTLQLTTTAQVNNKPRVENDQERKPGKSLAAMMAEAGLTPIPGITPP